MHENHATGPAARQAKRHNRWVLLGIAALFFIPLLLAVLLNSRWAGWQPETINHGELVTPPLPFDWQFPGAEAMTEPASAADHPSWTLLYLHASNCDADCVSEVTMLRQLHRSLGRNQDKVRIALLGLGPADTASQATLSEIYPLFALASDPSGAAAEQLAGVNADAAPVGPGQAFLLDPEYRIMLRYAAGFEARDAGQDLKRLLKWSTGE